MHWRFLFLFLIFFETPIVSNPNFSADSVFEITQGWTFETAESKAARSVQVGKALSQQGWKPPLRGRYRLNFLFQRSVEPFGVYFDRIQEADELWVNGHKIASTGRFSENGIYEPNWYYKRLYFIPNHILFEDKTNELVLEIEFKNPTFQGGLFRSIPRMGNYTQLQKLVFWEDGRDFCFILLFLGIGAYQIFSIILNRKRKQNLFLLVSTACFVLWRLPLLNFSYDSFDLPFSLWLRIFFTAQTLLPVSIFLFSYSLFQSRWKILDKTLVLFLVTIGFIQSLPIGLELRIVLLRIWELSLIFVVGFILHKLWIAIRNQQMEAYFLAIGFLAISFGATIDIWIDITSGQNIYLSQYGFLILMIASGLSISYQNARNERELALLTKDLEVRVKERTRELVKKNEDLELDLRFASQLQTYLLPKEAPNLPNLTIQPVYLPMQQVGGDFYDWVLLDTNRLIILLADVAGHGVPAAFVSSMVKVQFRESVKSTSSPKEILAIMNQSLTPLVSRYFVTATCMLIDVEENFFVLSNAGHPNPIFYNRKNNLQKEISLKGPIIGWRDDFQFEEWKESLRVGDRIFLFTDGVTEARGAKRIFGEDALVQFLRNGKDLSPRELSQNLVLQLTKFSDGVFQDDVTFLVLDYR